VGAAAGGAVGELSQPLSAKSIIKQEGLNKGILVSVNNNKRIKGKRRPGCFIEIKQSGCRQVYLKNQLIYKS
jgi:hypothetical protein